MPIASDSGRTRTSTRPAIGILYTPAMAMLSDGAETFGVAQGFAFALVNLAWATGQVVGNGAGGGLAEVTADVVPLLVVSLLCFATFLALTRRARPAVRSTEGFQDT